VLCSFDDFFISFFFLSLFFTLHILVLCLSFYFCRRLVLILRFIVVWTIELPLPIKEWLNLYQYLWEPQNLRVCMSFINSYTTISCTHLIVYLNTCTWILLYIWCVQVNENHLCHKKILFGSHYSSRVFFNVISKFDGWVVYRPETDRTKPVNP